MAEPLTLVVGARDFIGAAIARRFVKQERMHDADRSVAQGAFGSPSFFVGNDLLFGKDRVRDVEEEILRRNGTSA